MPIATACAGGWIVVDAYCQEFSHHEVAANQVPVAPCLGRLTARAIFRQKV
jgi:hypothetical protein